MDLVNEKSALFRDTQRKLEEQGFTIDKQDQTRPWGGFFVINEDQAQQFADTYFNGISVDQLRISGKLSPKILIVAPEKRLSWQFHHRRAEIWQVIQGRAIPTRKVPCRCWNPAHASPCGKESATAWWAYKAGGCWRRSGSIPMPASLRMKRILCGYRMTSAAKAPTPSNISSRSLKPG